jgi:cell division cycle protein 37
MEELEREKQDFAAKKKLNGEKLKEVKRQLTAEPGKTEELAPTLAELEKEAKEIFDKEQELQKKEKKTPWNVDTISKPGFQKTVINKQSERPNYDDMTDEEKEKTMREFTKSNEKLLKQYGMLRKYEDSMKFLQQHHHLVGENTANYLVIWCINLEMEEKHELMQHVAHQCICMQYILELSRQLDVDPRACVPSFFSRIQVAEPEYKKQFENEVEAFKGRIQKRAAEKVKEAIAEAEEEERKARLGPGGLDPAEVFEQLPQVRLKTFEKKNFKISKNFKSFKFQELQACFESRDIGLLQETIGKMTPDLAKKYMKMCVDSGLWVPEGGLQKDGENAEEEDEIYEEATGGTAELPKTLAKEQLDLD